MGELQELQRQRVLSAALTQPTSPVATPFPTLRPSTATTRLDLNSHTDTVGAVATLTQRC